MAAEHEHQAAKRSYRWCKPPSSAFSTITPRNFFDQGGIPPFKRNQFGGAAGGPILKDRMFVFGNYEGFCLRLGISDVTIVPDANARQGLLPNTQGVPTPVMGLNPDMLRYMALWPAPNGPDLGRGYAKAYSNPKQSIREDFGTSPKTMIPSVSSVRSIRGFLHPSYFESASLASLSSLEGEAEYCHSEFTALSARREPPPSAEDPRYRGNRATEQRSGNRRHDPPGHLGI